MLNIFRTKGKDTALLTLELAEVKEIADIIFERLEKKIEVLKAIEASVDEKIATLERLNKTEESIATHSGSTDRQHEVITLKQRGLKIDEIANILDMPAGEVELILNLYKDREIFVNDARITQPEQENYSKKPIKNKSLHNVFSQKILGTVTLFILLIGIVVTFILIQQKNNVPLKPQKIEQGLNIQKQESPQEEKSQAVYSEQKKQKKTIIVIADAATLRSKPSLDSEPVTWASKGVVLGVVEEFTDDTGKKWYKVVTSEGRECWITDKVVQLG